MAYGPLTKGHIGSLSRGEVYLEAGEWRPDAFTLPFPERLAEFKAAFGASLKTVEQMTEKYIPQTQSLLITTGYFSGLTHPDFPKKFFISRAIHIPEI